MRGVPIFTILCAISLNAGLGAVDPRSIDPVTLTLSDWLGFRGDDRRLFMVGFAAGWTGPTPPAQPLPIASDDDEESTDEAPTKADFTVQINELDTQIAKLANKPGNQNVLVITVLSRAMILDRLPVREITGLGWTALPVRHRMLILQGVHGGDYSRAVWEAANQPRDGATLSKALRAKRGRINSTLVPQPLYVLSRLGDEFRSGEGLDDPLIDILDALSKDGTTP